MEQVSLAGLLRENIWRLCLVGMAAALAFSDSSAGVNFKRLSLNNMVNNMASAALEEIDFEGKEDYEIYDLLWEQGKLQRNLKLSETATPIEEFTYQVYGNEVFITKYNGVATEVEIPNVIEGYPVTKIDRDAFAGNIYLEKVVLPDTVMQIERAAFNNCDSLTTVDASSRLMSIGDYAFEFCDALTTFTKRESENSLPYYTIGQGAFKECPALESFTFTDGEPFAETHIYNQAFWGCVSLQNVEFADNLAVLGERVFEGCTNITEAVIPASVKEIGYGVFLNCTSLAKATLEERVLQEGDGGTVLGAGMFTNTALTEINIPASYCGIGDLAFEFCSMLETVTIAGRVLAPEENGMVMGRRAFAGTAISEIHIPGCYFYLEEKVFEDCPNLTTFIWEDSGRNVTCQGTGNYLFYNSYEMKEIHLPKTIDSIGYWSPNEMGAATIYAPKGSEAARYAAECGFTVVEE